MAQAEPKTDSNQVVVRLTMTLEEAKKTIWRAGEPYKPIAELLNSGEKTIRDIAWASQSAYDESTREACRAILSHLLGEAKSTYGPEVVEGSHYLEETEKDDLLQSAYIIGLGVGFSIWTLISIFQILFTYVIPQMQRGNLLAPIIFGIFFVIYISIIAFMFYREFKPSLDRYRDFRIGRKGEERILDILRMVLDNSWIIFSNLRLPERKADIDIVLIGPRGVWVIETKSPRGTLRAKGDVWKIHTKRGWTPLNSNPSLRAKANAFALRDFLQRQGINIRWIQPVVALGENQPVENFEECDPPVWLPPTIKERATNLTTNYPLNSEVIGKIIEQLTTRAKEQIAVEKAKYGE